MRIAYSIEDSINKILEIYEDRILTDNSIQSILLFRVIQRSSREQVVDYCYDLSRKEEFLDMIKERT